MCMPMWWWFFLHRFYEVVTRMVGMWRMRTIVGTIRLRLLIENEMHVRLPVRYTVIGV
jgi:hypothetical protein